VNGSGCHHKNLKARHNTRIERTIGGGILVKARAGGRGWHRSPLNGPVIQTQVATAELGSATSARLGREPRRTRLYLRQKGGLQWPGRYLFRHRGSMICL
jgi:hypothetical protein